MPLSDIQIDAHVKSSPSGGGPTGGVIPSKTRQTLIVILQLIGIVAMMVLLFS